MRNPTRTLAVAAAVLATAAVLVGCGTSGTAPSGSATLSSSTAAAPTPETNPAGDIPDNQAFVPFTPPTGVFTVSVPEGWARSTDGAATIFTDKLNTVRIETTPPRHRPQYRVGQCRRITGHRVVHPWLPVRDRDCGATQGRSGHADHLPGRLTPEPGHRQNRDRRDRALRVLARRPRSDPDPVRPGRRRQRRPVADHHRFPAVAVTAQPATPPALEARSLYRFYRAGDEETLALQGVSLRLEAGEFVAVAGPSGSGKSTLLACLAGMDNPDGGSVRIAGQRISHRPEPERARIRARHIGMLFQNANLLDHLTVAQNLSLVRSLAGRAHRADRPDLLSLLGLSERAAAYPGQLSGGELARAGLAIALANRPAALLADEPTGELDSVTESRVLDLLSVAAAGGTAILVASHSPAVAAAAARVIRLDDGRVC